MNPPAVELVPVPLYRASTPGGQHRKDNKTLIKTCRRRMKKVCDGAKSI